jgi:hypothetical protein
VLKGIFKGVLHILGGLVAGLVIVVVLLSWRLSSGPLSLAFLSPHIESAFRSFQRAIDVRLDDTVLTWAGWDRTLDIRIVNVRALGPDETVIASVPEMSFSLSVQALLKGKVAPQTIELFRPKIHFVRNRDQSISVGFADGSKTDIESLQDVIDAVGNRLNSTDSISYLSRVSIIDADMTIVDETLGSSWSAPAAQIHLDRIGRNIKGRLKLGINIDGQHAQIDIEGDYQAEKKRIEIGLSFSKIRPALFSNLSQKVETLKMVNMPLQGTITASMLANGTVLSIGFDIDGGSGHVIVPPPLDQYLGVQKFELQGRFNGIDREINIENLFVDFGEGQTLFLPAPMSHEMPIASLRATGRYTAERSRLNLSSLDLDLDGPKISLTTLVDGIGGETTIMSRGLMHNLKINDFPKYWPRAIGTVPWEWATTHLSSGLVKETLADVVLRVSKDGKFSVESLTGNMQIEHVDVNYMDGMPLIKNVSGSAKFNRERFDFFVKEGETEGLKITKGIILMSGLNEQDQLADIDLSIEGPLENYLKLIDEKPLGFAAKQGINLNATKGKATTHLKLNLPMENNLEREQIDVLVTARLRDVTFPSGELGDVSEGQLDLKLDKTGMDIVGLIKYGSIPATLNWRSNFEDNSSFRQRFVLKGRVSDRQRMEQLKLNYAPFSNDYLNGPLDMEVVKTDFDNKTSEVDVSANLTNTSFRIQPLGWEKPAGKPGIGYISMLLENGKLAKVSRFSLRSDGLAVDGAVEFTSPGESLKHIVFKTIKVGKTDMEGIMKRLPRGEWAASFGGESLDLSSHLARNDEKLDASKKDEDDTKIQLSADFKRVWLNERHWISKAEGRLTKDDGVWVSARLTGEIGKKEKNTFRMAIGPQKNGNRRLVVQADDAGETLKAFDLYENMLDGKLDVQAEYDDALPSRPIKGVMTVENYRIIKAPTLARLASVASIVGILENLNGKGLSFNSLELPFQLDDGLLTVKDASAKSISLGLTASGEISLKRDNVDIEGTFIPMYALNSVLSNIPVVGSIFSGGDKNGGVFAASYSLKGSVKDPKIGVNPLTVLAPGFLRNIFKIFKPGEPIPKSLDDGFFDQPSSL